MSGNPITSPNLPWKTRLSISVLSFFMSSAFRRNMTVNRFLFGLCDSKSSTSNEPKNGVRSFDIVIDTSRDLWFRLYTPTNATAANLPVIIYFHGGGFVVLAANSRVYDDHCRRLAGEVPAVVISVNYRLSPEHRCPSQYEDGIETLKFIDSTNIEILPAYADLKNCFLAGDSAGGNLAHNVVVLANECNFSKLKLKGLVAIQPFFGGEERTESEIRFMKDPLVALEHTDWMWKAFLPEGSNRDHPGSNVFGPNAGDISCVNFPATIVFIGGFDPLKDWQKIYCEGLKKCGKEAYLIEYPNAVHCFDIFPELPECSLFLKDVKDFICSQIAK